MPWARRASSRATGQQRSTAVNQFVSSNAQFANPTVYSLEAWFKTTTTSGGKIIGFGDVQTGISTNYDRHVYMQNDGRLVFGAWTGVANTITSASAYNDNAWHHVVATQSGNGMKLYVDGELVGTNRRPARRLHRLLEGRRGPHLGLDQQLPQRHDRRGCCLLRRAELRPG